MNGRDGRSDSAERTPVFDQFADVVEPDLLRAAWLLTDDRHHAGTLASDALVAVKRQWKHVSGEQPVVAVYRELVTSVRRSGASGATGSRFEAEEEDPLEDRRLATEAAFAALPVEERTAVVLHNYSNLSTVQTARAMDMKPEDVKRLSDRGMRRLRSAADDFSELPYDDVPSPVVRPNREQINHIASLQASTTRRRALIGAAAGVGLLAAGAWGLVQSRPPVGRASASKALVDKLVPPKVISTGIMFAKLREMPTPTLGALTLREPLGNEARADLHLQLTPTTPTTIAVTADGLPQALQESAWGCSWFSWNGQSVALAQAPSDTDYAWPVVNGQQQLDADTFGTELSDHRPFVGSWTNLTGPVDGFIWQANDGRVGATNGEIGGMTEFPYGPKLFALPTAGLWGVIYALDLVQLDTLNRDSPVGNVGVGGDGTTWSAVIVPKGCTDVRVQKSPAGKVSTVAIEQLGGTGLTGVLAYTTVVDGAGAPMSSLIDAVTWTNSDGSPGSFEFTT